MLSVYEDKSFSQRQDLWWECSIEGWQRVINHLSHPLAIEEKGVQRPLKNRKNQRPSRACSVWVSVWYICNWTKGYVNSLTNFLSATPYPCLVPVLVVKCTVLTSFWRDQKASSYRLHHRYLLMGEPFLSSGPYWSPVSPANAMRVEPGQLPSYLMWS